MQQATFPVWGVDDSGSCLCSPGLPCRHGKPGKHPRGFPHAPPDFEEGDHEGFFTGSLTGVFVVDCDVDKDTGEQVGLNAYLELLGCDRAQGFFYAPAVPAEQFADQVREPRTDDDPVA